MAKTFFLEIFTPERKFFTGYVESLVIKTPEGEMGILAGHIPVVSVVDIGPVRIKSNGKWMDAALGEGFIEVTRDRVVVLADTAEWPYEIDVNRALAAKQRAEERLRQKVDYNHSKAALTRAMARLKVTRKRS